MMPRQNVEDRNVHRTSSSSNQKLYYIKSTCFFLFENFVFLLSGLRKEKEEREGREERRKGEKNLSSMCVLCFV